MDEDRVITMLLNHEERLERIETNMATKSDIREMSTNIDTLVKFAKKKDEELTMMSHGASRREDRIQVLEDDMKKVKPAVGLA